MTSVSGSSPSGATDDRSSAPCWWLTISRSSRSIGEPVRQTTRVLRRSPHLLADRVLHLDLVLVGEDHHGGALAAALLAIASSPRIVKTVSDQPRISVWSRSSTRERPLRSSHQALVDARGDDADQRADDEQAADGQHQHRQQEAATSRCRRRSCPGRARAAGCRRAARRSCRWPLSVPVISTTGAEQHDQRRASPAPASRPGPTGRGPSWRRSRSAALARRGLPRADRLRSLGDRAGGPGGLQPLLGALAGAASCARHAATLR